MDEIKPLPPEPPPQAGAASEYRSVQDITLDKIRRCVVTGVYPPGSRLGVREVAQSLGVSAAPVREALKQLAAENLVEFRPRFGFFARALSPIDLLEVFEIRVHLERLAVGYSLPQLTADELAVLADCVERLERAGSQDEWLHWNRAFHFALYSGAERPRLLAIIANLWDTIEAYLRLYLSYVGRPTEAQADHWQMLAGARRHDAAQVQAVLQAHLERTCEKVVEGMQGKAKEAR